VGHQVAVSAAPGRHQKASQHHFEGAATAGHCPHHACHMHDLCFPPATTVLKIAVRSQLPRDVPEPERMLFVVRSTNPVRSSVKRVKKSHVTLPRGFIPPHIRLRYPRISSAVIRAYPRASQRAPEYHQILTHRPPARPFPVQPW
jgi:hypothetical protein